MASGTEHILNKSADNTKLHSAIKILEGRDAIQMDLDRFESWVRANLMKFQKGQVEGAIPRLGQSQSWKQWEMHWSSPEEDLGLLVDDRFNTSQQHVPVDQKTNQDAVGFTLISNVSFQF